MKTACNEKEKWAKINSVLAYRAITDFFTPIITLLSNSETFVDGGFLMQIIFKDIV